MYEGNPELQKKWVADSFIARGDYEGAKRVLSSVQPADPRATAALKIAKIQEQKGEIEKAADSTIEAIRLTPKLLSDEQLPLIKKAGRVHQLGRGSHGRAALETGLQQSHRTRREGTVERQSNTCRWI